MTVGSPPSRTATTEFVVPRSMPTARAMLLPPDEPVCVDYLSVSDSSLRIDAGCVKSLESARLNPGGAGLVPAAGEEPARAALPGLGLGRTAGTLAARGPGADGERVRLAA